MAYRPDHGAYREDFRFHPYNILLVLVLFSITALFLAFSIAYIYSRFDTSSPPVRVPSIFIFNTLVLLGGSYTLVLTKRAYRNDQTELYKRFLAITLGLTFLFLILQIIGWQQMFEQQISISSSTSASYLYVISALHFAHVVAGIPFLGIFLITAWKRMREPVSVLVYFSDPEKKLKLRLLTLYWHFIDGLWIYLVVFFGSIT